MSAHNFKDLTGLRFDRLLVLSRSAQNGAKGQPRWNCKCDCGKDHVVQGSNLRMGYVKSCGCIRLYLSKIGRSKRAIDMTGKRFGRLLVVCQSGQFMYGKSTAWTCQCDCGQQVLCTRTMLLRKYRTCCGCEGSDLNGNQYGKLTVTGREYKGVRFKWKCRCECGKEKSLCRHELESGAHKSCGCIRVRQSGLSRSPEYQAWNSMKSRCLNDREANRRYFGRGIGICDRWMVFENFYTDMGLRPSKCHSVERRDNDSGYCKENCYWATKKEQARNRHTNTIYECDGKKQCLAAWSEEYAIGAATIIVRMKKGWSFEKALKTPVRKSKPRRKNSENS